MRTFQGHSLSINGFLDEKEYLRLVFFMASGLISWLFHPVVLTPFCLGVVILAKHSDEWNYGLPIYVCFALIAPLTLVGVMKNKGLLTDWNASNQKQRPKLLIAVSLGGFLSELMILCAKSHGFKSPELFSFISLAQGLSGLGLFLATRWFIKTGSPVKPSFHVGGTCIAMSILITGGMFDDKTQGINVLTLCCMLMAMARVHNRHHCISDTVISFLICGLGSYLSYTLQ